LTPQVSLRADGEFSSAFHDSSVPTGMVRLGGYQVVNAAIVWRVVPSIELSLAVRNIADQHYDHVVGTPEPGRNVFLALRKTM
jgi:outer membrane cobalamin receptor